MNSSTERSSENELSTSTPAAQHMDPALIVEAANAATNLTNLLAYVAIRNGSIVAEHYYRNRSVITPNHVRSVTKSIVSVLVGIALDLGIIPNLATPVLDYLPEHDTYALDERKRAITLDHLLTMTAGFQWDELSFDPDALAMVHDWFSGGKRSALYDMLQRPLVHTPGTTFTYDSPAADLISVILTRAAGQDLQTFAIEHLFDPLGITDFTWETDPVGFYRGSAGLAMHPRDLAKVGLLCLQKGRWQARQIVSAAWIEQSTNSHIPLVDGHGYGRLWWVSTTAPIRFFSAVGYGGQLLLVAPQHQLVVVANHKHDVPAESAVKQSRDFYDQVFVKIVASTR